MGLHELNSNTENTPVQIWIIPATIIGISVVIMFAGDLGREAVRYDRVWIGQGETWRFLSGHFAHLGWSHLALNSAGLVLIWFLIGGTYEVSSWLTVVAVSLATIDSGFWLLNPELYWYVGMSGLLHGLLAAGLVPRLHQISLETGVLLLLLVAKIGWEQFGGPLPGSELTSGGPVVVDAHLYGALGGVLGALLLRIRVRAQPSI
jgi:rhomboid family GlyGly-CTERM serine protease